MSGAIADRRAVRSGRVNSASPCSAAARHLDSASTRTKRFPTISSRRSMRSAPVKAQPLGAAKFQRHQPGVQQRVGGVLPPDARRLPVSRLRPGDSLRGVQRSPRAPQKRRLPPRLADVPLDRLSARAAAGARESTTNGDIDGDIAQGYRDRRRANGVPARGRAAAAPPRHRWPSGSAAV